MVDNYDRFNSQETPRDDQPAEYDSLAAQNAYQSQPQLNDDPEAFDSVLNEYDQIKTPATNNNGYGNQWNLPDQDGPYPPKS